MIDLQILKKQNDLLVDDDGLIMVKPIDRHNFETFPLQDLAGCLRLTMEEYLGLRAGYYRFNENLNSLEINEKTISYVGIELEDAFENELNC